MTINKARIFCCRWKPLLAVFCFLFFFLKGHGKYLRIMDGMFRANGGCGYIKKPAILTVGNDDEVLDLLNGTLPVIKILKASAMRMSIYSYLYMK